MNFYFPLHSLYLTPISISILSLFLSELAYADIYRFVTIDGVEIFTDAPSQKGAKIVIKENPRKNARSKKTAEKTHSVSLNEIVDKTVLASIYPAPDAKKQSDLSLPLPGGIITSVVGMRIDPIDGRWRQHNGVDISVREGTPVYPVRAGVVAYSGLRSGYGNTVLIEHDNGMVTLYAHNSTLAVAQGQLVDPGTVIAHSGNTGRSTGPHLHFEAWQAGVNITPAFLPGNAMKLPTGQLASNRSQNRFHREVLADGSLLFTNIPSSKP